MTVETSDTGGLSATTPYLNRTKPFISEKSNSRTAGTSTEAGPSNFSRAKLAGFDSRKTAHNHVYELDDEDDENDFQEVEAKTIPRGNGKRKETHAVENEDDEIQEVEPPTKMTRSRKPPSTVNGKPTSNGAAKGKAKAKPPKLVAKPAHESMNVDSNDVVEHDMDVDVNGVAAIANDIHAAMKHNGGWAPKIQSGQQNEDGPIARLEGELRQVRFRSIGNYRPC